MHTDASAQQHAGDLSRAAGAQKVSLWSRNLQLNRYALQRRRGFSMLRFFADLEQEYLEQHRQVAAIRIRWLNLLGIAGIVLFVGLNRYFGQQPLEPGSLWLMLVFAPVLLLMPVALTLVHCPVAIFHAAVLAATLGLALCNIAVITLSAPERGVPYESLILVIIYVYFVSGLHISRAVLCGIVIVASYVGLQYWLGHRPGILHNEAFFLLAANCIGGLGLYFLEYQDRLAFLTQNELRSMASEDGLTGLLSLRAFMRNLRSVWRQAQREREAVGLLLLEMEDPEVAKGAQEPAADSERLHTMAELLKSHTRHPLDAAGRVGRNQFAMLWFGVEPSWFESQLADLINLSERARQAGQLLAFSGGAIFALPQVGISVTDCLKLADQRLEEVKATTRNNIGVSWIRKPRDLELSLALSML